jgi:phage shock protein A
MKTSNLLAIGLVLLSPLVLPSCSEKGRAAVKVLHTKTEDRLVAAAGEGEVALELMKNQYSDLKERLVKVKTLKRTMERRVEECEATAKRLDAESKGSMADRQRALATRYKANVEKLRVNEIKSEEALKSFAADYKEFKQEVAILKEEIESAKAMGGLSDDLSVDSPLNTRMETVQDLKGKLQAQLDRADSLMEVNELEADL